MNDETPQKEDFLGFTARRAADRPYFMASALESFRQREGLDRVGLAAYLGLPLEQLDRLALCARPNITNSRLFRTQLAAITVRFGIAPTPLANLLRRVAAYEADSAPANLMAARDYDEESSTDSSQETPKDE